MGVFIMPMAEIEPGRSAGLEVKLLGFQEK
jgi:hypothetical protein